MKALTHAQNGKKANSIVNNHKLIKIYYTALMTFLVFTFADKLLQGLIDNYSRAELWWFAVLWISLVIQTTYAYKHIREIPQERYSIRALFSYCLDIGIEIFICAAVSSACRDGKCSELSYLLISIPFMLMAVNQFYWYVVVDEFNPRALLCLNLLFAGMLLITISEAIYHGIWNLTFIVIWHTITMAILRIRDKAPRSFEEKAKPIWGKIKENSYVQKIAWGNSNNPQ